VTRVVITVLVLVHLVAAVWHGEAHTDLEIDLPPVKDAFVYIVIVSAPILAAVLAWTRRLRLALWVFVLSMLGALLFGVYHHYILISPDNVAHLPPGSPGSHSHFIDSAAAIAILELSSVAYGVLCLVRGPRAGADR
jgi:hypothetical protein